MESLSSETLTAIEQRIARDKLAKFKGAARVSIHNLDFPHPIRGIDKKAIQQLIRDFDGEGCIRAEPSHRIPAVIDNSILQAALQKMKTPLTAESFKAKADNPPILKLGSGVKLECLHGQHRVLAAKEHLPASQWWWVVDLYGTDLNRDTKQALREGYSYSAKYKSGEIFRQMRLCYYDNDPFGVQRWRGRFTDSQAYFLEHLLSKRPILIAALDSILHIQGVWREFYIGSLNAFLFPRIDEEIACYIRLIKKILTHIFNGDVATMMQTDPITIRSIQSRVPALSKSDYEWVQENSGVLFPGVIDPVKKTDIIQRLLATDELIPSLYTLLKDIRYLKQPAEFLSKLLPESRMKTLRERWFHYFAGTDTVEIQRGVSGPFRTIPSTHLDSFDVCYQQLWLCSYRVCKYSNAYGRLMLAELADKLGFSTPKIGFEVTQDPAQAMIEKTLREAFHILQPNKKFKFDANKARPVITSFKEYLDSLDPALENTSLQITITGTEMPLSWRCGHSEMDSRDLDHLFLDKIHAPLSEYRRDGDEISSFYVKRSRHIAFFGSLDLTGNRESESTQHERVQYESISAQLQHTSGPHLVGDVTGSSSASASLGDPNVDEGTQGANQVVERVITFIENDLPLRVPFREKDVNDQAKEYADQGKKLFVNQGPYFIWKDCFEILTRTRQSTVSVTTVSQPVNGKRRFNQELPDGLIPATKNAYDFSMDEEDEDEY